MGNEGMLEYQALVGLFEIVVMVPKRKDREEVSTIGCVVSIVRKK